MNPHPCQRTKFMDYSIVSRRLDPWVGICFIGIRFCLACRWIQTAGATVPWMSYVFVNIGRVNRLIRRACVPPPVQKFVCPGIVEVEDTICQQVTASLTDVVILRKNGSNGINIGNVNIVNKGADFGKKWVEVAYFIRSSYFRTTSRRKTWRTRKLASEYRTHLMCFSSYCKGLHIMINQVDSYAAGNHVIGNIAGTPGCDIKNTNRIYIIQCRKMVKMEHMWLYKVCTQNQITQYSSIIRHSNPESIFESLATCHAMRYGTDSTDPLGKMRCIKWVVIKKYLFKTPEHCSGAFCVNYLLFTIYCINSDLDFQVTFNSC